MEKLTIWLDLIASLLALVAWDANEARRRLDIINKNLSNWAKKYKGKFFGVLAVLFVIDILSVILTPISLFVSVFLGGVGGAAFIPVKSLAFFYLTVSFLAFLSYSAMAALERIMGFMCSGEIQKKWVRLIAGIFFISCFLKLYTK